MDDRILFAPIRFPHLKYSLLDDVQDIRFDCSQEAIGAIQTEAIGAIQSNDDGAIQGGTGIPGTQVYS